MQPLNQEIRKALLSAHPGLEDADIDRLDALNALSPEVHAVGDEAKIRELELEIVELIEKKMPHYWQIVQALSIPDAPPQRVEPPEIEIKSPMPKDKS